MPQSERQWLVNVAGVAGLFQTKSGGGVSVEHSKDFDGGALTPDIYQGAPTYEDLTVSRPFQVPRDTQVRQSLQRILAAGQRFDTVVTCTPTNESMVPIGTPETYQCTLMRVNPGEANTNSGNPSRLELVFTVRSVT